MELLEPCLVAQEKSFVQLTEPTITFYQGAIKINTACLKKLPGTEYVLFLVNPGQRKLYIKPCEEEMQHSMRWRTPSGKPRTLIGRDFLSKAMELMQWDSDQRYRLPGRASFDEEGAIVAFDMTAAQAVEGFGQTLREHKQNPLVRRLEEDTVITMEDNSDGQLG